MDHEVSDGATNAKSEDGSRPQVDDENEWDAYADSWDDDETAQTYAAAAFKSLEAVLANTDLTLHGANIVDFGCGTGLLTERLVSAGAAIQAVDTSTAMLDVLRSKADLHDWPNVRTSTELPDARGTQDLIVCSSVCSFLEDYPGMVKRLVDLLGPGGMFVQWDWERDEADKGAHGLTRTEINDALRTAGLADVLVETAFEVLMEDQTMQPLIGHGQRPPNSP
jgi:2-polyprenyl-3-methyl-5-hydroxy-6-metoxy-1,4-benzoquinol methylase